MKLFRLTDSITQLRKQWSKISELSIFATISEYQEMEEVENLELITYVQNSIEDATRNPLLEASHFIVSVAND